MRFIIARGVLRKMLGCYLGVKPNEIRFCYGSHGKPRLEEYINRISIRFNLSHAQGFVLYAVNLEQDVGVDLEQVRSISEIERIAELTFSRREREFFCALSPDKKLETFFKIWTCKEALAKAIGEGLTMSLNQIEVSLTSREQIRILSIGCNLEEATNWSLYELKPIPNYIAALAVK